MATIYYVIDMHDKIVATFCMREDAVEFVRNKEPLCTIRDYTFADEPKREKNGRNKKA